MCIGVPRQLLTVDGHWGRHEAGAVDLALVAGSVRPGDWVLVHAGTAVSTLAPDEALLIEQALLAADAATRGLPFDHLFADLVDREPELPAHLRPTPSGEPAA